MVFYETTYILHSALQEGRLNDIISVIEKKAESFGAKILFSDNWGRKKLSYLIEKEKYGTYVFFQYKVKDLSKLSELTAEFEHNPNILRYLNIKIEEEDIMSMNTTKRKATENKDVTTSKKVEHTVVVKNVSEVREEPAEVKEEPAEVKEKPAEVKEKPAEVKEKPAEVKEKPAEVKEEPAEVKEEPAEVKEEPAEVKEEPTKEENISKKGNENNIEEENK